MWEGKIRGRRLEAYLAPPLFARDEKDGASGDIVGRLAVSEEMRGQGIGSILLAKALSKAYENADVVGSSMVVADALDERAAGFYRAHGFIRLPESMRLVLPMRTIAGLIPR